MEEGERVRGEDRENEVGPLGEGLGVGGGRRVEEVAVEVPSEDGGAGSEALDEVERDLIQRRAREMLSRRSGHVGQVGRRRGERFRKRQGATVRRGNLRIGREGERKGREAGDKGG